MWGNVRPENDTCPLPILIALAHPWMTGILRGVCTLSKKLFPSLTADAEDISVKSKTGHKQTIDSHSCALTDLLTVFINALLQC